MSETPDNVVFLPTHLNDNKILIKFQHYKDRIVLRHLDFNKLMERETWGLPLSIEWVLSHHIRHPRA